MNQSEFKRFYVVLHFWVRLWLLDLCWPPLYQHCSPGRQDRGWSVDKLCVSLFNGHFTTDRAAMCSWQQREHERGVGGLWTFNRLFSNFKLVMGQLGEERKDGEKVGGCVCVSQKQQENMIGRRCSVLKNNHTATTNVSWTLNLPIRGLNRADWQLIQPIRKLTQVTKLSSEDETLQSQTNYTTDSQAGQSTFLTSFPCLLSSEGEGSEEKYSSSLLQTRGSRRHKQQPAGVWCLPLCLQPTLRQSDSETQSQHVHSDILSSPYFKNLQKSPKHGSKAANRERKNWEAETRRTQRERKAEHSSSAFNSHHHKLTN